MIDDISYANNIVHMNLFNKFKQNNLLNDAIISCILIKLSILSFMTQNYIMIYYNFSFRNIIETWNSLFYSSIKLVGTKYVKINGLM